MYAFTGSLGRHGRAIGLATLVIGSGPALAADTPEQIIDAYMANYRTLGATTAGHGAISQDGDVTTIENVEVVIPFELPLGTLPTLEGSVKVTSPLVSAERISIDGDTFQAGRLSYPKGFTVSFDFLVPNKTPDQPSETQEDAPEAAAPEGKTEAKKPQHITYQMNATNLEVVNYKERKIERPAFDASTPIKSFLSATADYLSSSQAELVKTPKLELRFAATGIEQVSQYDNLVVRGINGLQIESYEADGASQSSRNSLSLDDKGPNMSMNVTAGRMFYHDMDFRPVFRLVDPALFPDLTSDIVIGDGGINDYSVEMEKEDLTIKLDELTLHEFAMGKPEAGLAKLLDPLLLDGAPEDEDEFFAAFIPLLTKYNLGQFNMKSLHINQGATRIAQIGLVDVSDMTPRGIGSIVVEGAGISNPKNSAQFGLSRLAISDITYADYEALLKFKKSQARLDIPAMLAAVPTIGGIEIKDFAMAPANAPVTLSLDSYELGLHDFIGPIPTRIANVLEGLNLPVAMITNPNARRVAKAMGFDALQINQTLLIDWNEATQDLTLEQAGIRLENGGSATLRVTLGGVPKVVFEDPSRAKEAIASLTIKSGSLVIEDAEIITAMLEQESKKNDVPVETIRSGTVAQVRAALGPLSKTPFADELENALNEFLANPERLKISMEPGSPVFAAQLLGLAATAPETLTGLLNVKVSAN